VDDGGTPTLVYSGNRAGQQRTCLAIGDPELRVWTKLDSNPVIPAPPPGLDILEYRDHSVWREGDEWVQLMGAGIVGEGGAVLRYRSPDLREWTYDGVHLADESYSADSWTGDVWECPDFFPLGGSHVLVASAWAEGRTIRPFYITGRYVDGTFTPEHRERLDYGERHFYAPQSFTDTTGRRVMFGWIQEARSPASAHEVGWSGVMSLPRVVTLAPDGTVFQSPVPEVAQLRGATERHESVDLAASEHLDLQMRGDLVDLEVELALDETAHVAP
jgi:beta-fructofuranosidase